MTNTNVSKHDEDFLIAYEDSLDSLLKTVCNVYDTTYLSY